MPMIKALVNETETTEKMSIAVRAIEEQFPHDVVVVFVVANKGDDTQSLHISSNSSEEDTYDLIQMVASGIQQDNASEWRGKPN